MLTLNKNINVKINDNKNYRSLAKYKDKYVFTVFPSKHIYVLDKDLILKDSIKTDYYYGSVSYNNDVFICGCYSSLTTEIHILNQSGKILEKINYRKLMKEKDINREQFISFCHSSFYIDKYLYFVLKSSDTVYYINENNEVHSINLKKYFACNHILVYCACNYKNDLVSLVKVNDKYFVCKFTKNERQILIIEVTNLIDGIPTNIEYIDDGLCIVFEDVKNSHIKVILDEI